MRLWERYDQSTTSRFDPQLREEIASCGNADSIMTGQSLKLEVTEQLVDLPARCSIIVAGFMGETGWQVIGKGELSRFARLYETMVVAKVRKGDCEAYWTLAVGSPTGVDPYANPAAGALPPAVATRSIEALSGNCAAAGIPSACADYWVASFEKR